MIEKISTLLSDIIEISNLNKYNNSSERFAVQIITNSRGIYSLEPEIFESNNYFLYPLDAAISAPMIFRSTHYRNTFSDNNSKWSSLQEQILKEGERVISEKEGTQLAETWYYQMKSNVQELILSGKYSSIVLDSNGIGISQIVQSKIMGNVSRVDDLLLNLGGGGHLKIATRDVKNRFTNYSSRLEGFSPVKETYFHLLSLLHEFEKHGKQLLFKNHHHLFSWFSPTITQDKEFFDEVIENYLIDSTHGRSQSAHILLVFDLSSNVNNKFSALEKLALQRINFDGGWVLKSKSFTNLSTIDDIIAIINKVKIDSELLRYTPPIIIQSNSNLESSYVALMFECDVNSWIGSREIDGEQVMTHD
jgi:hypothetical protein